GSQGLGGDGGSRGPRPKGGSNDRLPLRAGRSAVQLSLGCVFKVAEKLSIAGAVCSIVAMRRRFELGDEEWAAIAGLLPSERGRKARPARNNGRMVRRRCSRPWAKPPTGRATLSGLRRSRAARATPWPAL